MKIDYKLLVSLIIFVGVSFIISKILSLYVQHWIKEAFLTGILCLILAFVTGLFKINAIFDILKERSKTETKI
jgi:Tfp pilus assembly major pilin PilA